MNGKMTTLFGIGQFTHGELREIQGTLDSIGWQILERWMKEVLTVDGSLVLTDADLSERDRLILCGKAKQLQELLYRLRPHVLEKLKELQPLEKRS